MTHKNKGFKILQYVFYVLVLIGTLGPYVWLFISSVSYRGDLITKPLRWIPSDWTWHRYVDIFANQDNNIAYAFKVSLLNSAIIAVSVTIIALIVGGLAAYAVGRLRFKFRQQLIYLFLFTYMIPSIVIVIPLYLIISNLGMVDSKITLILLNLTFILPFVIWIMQSYFSTISKDYEEAAVIDGCTRLQLIRYIIFPLAAPGFVATGILAFLLSWGEFLFGLIFSSTLNAKPISVAIAEFSGKFGVDYGLIATAGIIASLPPIIIAVFFQRYLITGMTAGGIKG